MSDQKISLSFSMDEIFELIPTIASDIVSYSPISDKISEMYKGTEFRYVFEIENEKYHLIIKDGIKFITGNEDLEDASVRIAIGMQDLEEYCCKKCIYVPGAKNWSRRC